MGPMSRQPPPVRVATVLGWAIAFGIVVDLWADGPPGIGVLVAAGLAAVGLVVVARRRAEALVFLGAGLASVSFVVFRASPVLLSLDLAAGLGLYALAGAFAREGVPVRTGLRSYVARGVAWGASVRPALAVVGRPLVEL